MPLTSSLHIPHRFNGPPTSGNGGWVGGALARALGVAAADVSLRAPPPLDADLTLRCEGPGHAALYDGERLLAEARAGGVDVEVPPAPSLDAARAAGLAGRLRAASRPDSPYARCFACGALRADGLRISPGRVSTLRTALPGAVPELDPADEPDDPGVVAADWTPPADLAEPDGTVRPEAIWAALDCPAGIAWSHRLGMMTAMMTARIQLAIDRAPKVGEACIVIGWPIAQDGRKLHAGTAIVDDAGVLRAHSRQLWLMPRDAGG